MMSNKETYKCQAAGCSSVVTIDKSNSGSWSQLNGWADLVVSAGIGCSSNNICPKCVTKLLGKEG